MFLPIVPWKPETIIRRCGSLGLRPDEMFNSSSSRVPRVSSEVAGLPSRLTLCKAMSREVQVLMEHLGSIGGGC